MLPFVRLVVALGQAVACGTTAYALQTTPIAYYPFDEATGSTTASDYYDNYDAIWQGVEPATFAPGFLGGAWAGTGNSGDYFTTPVIDALNGMNSYSISMWVKPTAGDSFSRQGLFLTRDASIVAGSTTASEFYGVSLREDYGIDSRVHGTPIDSPPSTVPIDTWTHIASVFDNDFATQTLYVNGELSNSEAVINEINILSAGQWLIGSDSCCNGREFNGILDDLALFDSALTPGEISYIYSNGIFGFPVIGFDPPLPIPGDVDEDGDVDAVELNNDLLSDFDIIVSNFLKPTDSRRQGDLNRNGRVDLPDFREWKNNYDPEPLGASAVSVPEPSTAGLTCLSLLIFLRPRCTFSQRR